MSGQGFLDKHPDDTLACYLKYSELTPEEEEFAKWLHRKRSITFLTIDWPLIQAGTGPLARKKWLEVLEFLELDDVIIKNIFLCIHQGIAGRTLANHLIWQALSKWSNSWHKDISNLMSVHLERDRQHFDKPTTRGRDAPHWSWTRVITPPQYIENFSPKKVPGWPNNVCMVIDPLGQPLPPPTCWAPPPPPPPPTSQAPPGAVQPPGPPGTVRIAPQNGQDPQAPQEADSNWGSYRPTSRGIGWADRSKYTARNLWQPSQQSKASSSWE